MRYDRAKAKLIADMGSKIEINEKDLPKTASYKENENELKDLIAIFYNLIMIFLWMAFAFCVLNEYN